MKEWMIYGANGYSGRLIAEEAQRRGHRPILAGRSREAVRALAERLGLAWRCFSLDDPEVVRTNLEGVRLVLHCAGPFSATSRPMVNACLQVRADYLDITGEIGVFEAIQKQGAELATAGISAIPGVGFDVVPSDCLAAMLKEKLPTARSLVMGMRPRWGGISPGTAKTMLEGAAEGGCVRRDGKLVRVPTAYKVARLPFEDGRESLAVTIPWGDVSTAYHSTGIPNVEFYMGTTPAQVRGMRLSRVFAPLIGLAPVQSLLKRRIEKNVRGPSDERREKGYALLWGEVCDDAGARIAMRMRTPEPYALTVMTAVSAVERLLAGNVTKGALTPSTAFGADFILSVAGVSVETVTMGAGEGVL